MENFTLEKILGQDSRAYVEFLRKESMSLGIYRLPAGGVDPQKPHTEDEAYYIISGRGMIRVGDESQPVVSSSVVFVKALDEHQFHSITEDLTILVFFAPAEYSQAADEGQG
jgi:mannose-6-phosphate isomerase-like protein (cupin superfamily)